MTQLDDTVVLDPNVRPADVERALIMAANLGWQHGGNDGRCSVPANFVGWALQEIERLRELLLKVARDEDRVAASTTMTRPAMREAAAETSAEIRRALEQSADRKEG